MQGQTTLPNTPDLKSTPTVFGTYCPLPKRPPLSHVLHWPFRAWADNLLRRPVELLAVATVVLLVLGSTLLYFAEHNSAAITTASGTAPIKTWWDAMWLCVTSATTDSYGDVAPVTLPGRVVSIIVAFLGIILVGSFTASITSYIIREPSSDNAMMNELRQRLDRIERLLVEEKPKG